MWGTIVTTRNTIVYRTVGAYEKNPVQFHIPGHKKGAGMDPEFRSFIGENALAIDLINISPLDDLHHPKGMIKRAQELAAEAFGADYTFFSVQGTSGAIMTMVMSVAGPGDKIIVPRNVHKSVMSAIVFSGATPIFIHPEIDKELGISHGITPQAVEKALHQHPDAKGVLVINPTYFGIAGDLKKSSRSPTRTTFRCLSTKRTECTFIFMRTCRSPRCKPGPIWRRQASISSADR